MWGRALILTVGLTEQIASAAPWVQEDGTYYVRVSLAKEEIELLSAWRSDVYLEYGLIPRLTLTAKAEQVFYPEATDFNVSGWRTTLRYQLYQRGAWRASLEGGVLQGAAIGGRNGCHQLGAEIRSGLAWSGLWREEQTFAFAELAARFYEQCRREHFEMGFGRQTSDHIWSITQVWLESGSVNAYSEKVQSELLWRSEFADYSIGYRNENGSDFTEHSVFIAVARQF